MMADQTRSELISALCLIVYVRKVHVRWWTNIFKKQLYKSIEQGHIWSNHKFNYNIFQSVERLCSKKSYDWRSRKNVLVLQREWWIPKTPTITLMWNVLSSWCHGAVVITTAKFHSTKLEVFCGDSSSARFVLEVSDLKPARLVHNFHYSLSKSIQNMI